MGGEYFGQKKFWQLLVCVRKQHTPPPDGETAIICIHIRYRRSGQEHTGTSDVHGSNDDD